MNMYHDSRDTSRSSPSDDTHPLLGACLRLPKAFTRTLAHLYDNDDPVWILVGPECDDNWNCWLVAYNEAASCDHWVVHRAMWWWGHSPATTRADEYVAPIYRAAEVAHVFDV